MTIKEVENLTGLTAKSIRLYESKGLIEIERDENNSYRDFTENNVKQLMFIKMMRYLDFSIQEIKELMDAEEVVIKSELEKKLDEYSKTEEVLNEKKLQEKKNKGSSLWIPGFIIIVVSTLVGAALLEFISTSIYEPGDYLFYQVGSTTMWIVMVIEITCVFFITDVIAKISKNDEWDNGAIGLFRKHRKWFIIVGIVAMYVAVTNITYVTQDEIIYHNWKHPAGVNYSYDDVTEIKTGYKSGLPNVKGEFYYKINVGDRWINFDTTTPNESIERYSDTYIEIDEFDKALMKYSSKKTSSHENEKYSGLDERYIELLGRVIDRK